MPAPPTATRRLTLLTAGDPTRLTGGHLYQRRMVDAAAAHGAEIRVVAVRRFPGGTMGARRVLETANLGDAILLDSIAAASAAPWLGAVSRPVVGVVHQVPGGVDGADLVRVAQAALDRLAYRRATGLVVVSEFLADRLVAAGLSRGRITVVRPGSDPVQRQAAGTEDLRQGRKAAVLCVASWTHNKGLHLLIEALARLSPTSATLHLVGDSSVEPAYTRRLRVRLAAEDVRNRVVIHGPLPPARVAGLLGAADVFALPSRHESYGTVYSEAMAAGLPIVAGNTDNLPYLVRDGLDGILVPPGNVPALAAALAALCGDPAIRARYGASARERAQGWPTWSDSADQFFAAINRVI